MSMNKLYIYLSAALIALCMSACSEKNDNLYVGPEFVMFSDTLSTCPVTVDGEYFSVPVVASTISKYDRTFGVQVIDSKSNAIENHHYRLESNSITIKAGEARADVRVRGIYDNIEPEDSLGFALELILPETVQTSLYGKSTNVVLMKACPFNVDAFTGYCVVTSTWLNEFSDNNSYQRLIWTERDLEWEKAHPDSDTSRIIFYDWQYDHYDIKMDFVHKKGKPLEPVVTFDRDQTICDELTAFGIIRGDNNIRIEPTSVYPAFYYSCSDYLTVGFRAYVNNLSEIYGYVGYFYNVMEWVSDAEARRLMNEEGMTCNTDPHKQ